MKLTSEIPEILSIPSCLILTRAQVEKLAEFVKSLEPITIEQHDEMFGGACLTSRLEFICWDTSIGFNLKVRDSVTGREQSLLTEEDLENS
jgi:hypothetical protein